MCIRVVVYTHLFNKMTPNMRTNIEIDDQLMKEALQTSRIKTKKEAVEQGLRLLIQRKKQERIKELKGKVRWTGDLDEMRRND